MGSCAWLGASIHTKSLLLHWDYIIVQSLLKHRDETRNNKCRKNASTCINVITTPTSNEFSCVSCISASDTICTPTENRRQNKEPLRRLSQGLAFKWPGSTRLVLAAHEVQESLNVCLCIARFGNINHLLQLLQSLTVRCDLSQAFLQGLLSGHLFLFRQASRVWQAWHRIIAWGIPQFRKLCLTLGCLQEMVQGAARVHCCAVGRNGRCTRGDRSNGASTKCVDIQKVLAEKTWCCGLSEDFGALEWPLSDKPGQRHNMTKSFKIVCLASTGATSRSQDRNRVIQSDSSFCRKGI